MFLYVFIFFCGGVSGSFHLCQAIRMIREEPWWRGRSHCEHCNHILEVYDLIPIFSYLVTRGKCRYCGECIGRENLIVEILSGVLSVLLQIYYQNIYITLIFTCIYGQLITIAIVDGQTYTIPLYSILMSFLLWVFYTYWTFSYIWFQVLFSILMGFMLEAISSAMRLVMKKETLGQGDILLIIVCSLYLEIFKIPLFLIISCILGILSFLIVKKKMIPFGPCIVISFMICTILI